MTHVESYVDTWTGTATAVSVAEPGGMIAMLVVIGAALLIAAARRGK